MGPPFLGTLSLAPGRDAGYRGAVFTIMNASILYAAGDCQAIIGRAADQLLIYF
jgi:hypothetical protein